MIIKILKYIGWINAQIVLTIVYIVITPIGIIFRNRARGTWEKPETEELERQY